MANVVEKEQGEDVKYLDVLAAENNGDKNADLIRD